MNHARKLVFTAWKLQRRLSAVLLLLFATLGDARLHRTPRIGPLAEITAETYDKYYNYSALTRRLQALAEKYPHVAELSSIGESVEGRKLWVMRITKDPSVDSPWKPKFKYVGNMHGDETVSRQVLVYLADYLLTNYGVDARVSELVNNTDISIMPSMNPDGFERSVEGDCQGTSGGRENGKQVDLNRSFPDQFDGTAASLSDVPEVVAVMRWIQENKLVSFHGPLTHTPSWRSVFSGFTLPACADAANHSSERLPCVSSFVLSGNLHGGSVVASYPFDDSASHQEQGRYSQTEDDGLFRYLAQVYSRNHPIMRTGQPNCSDSVGNTFKDGITNGAQWYDVSGEAVHARAWRVIVCVDTV